MDSKERIEHALEAVLRNAERSPAPPKLAEALRYSVFPGGARVRPRVCLAVASACGEDQPAVTDAVASSIELLHCASLVHDDLPCFDDAEERRGKLSVHAAYGEPLAVLVGDALIVLAFEALAPVADRAPLRLGSLLSLLARAAGSPSGLVAGQAWESESGISRSAYHRAKTGALFAAATVCGATAAGADPGPWRSLGDFLGEAYQVADDLRDVVADPKELGKPTGRDLALGRPSAVADLGVEGAVERLRSLIDSAVDSIPPCRGAASLRGLVEGQGRRLMPKALRESAA